MTRRTEQQQQKRIACLKPKNETILEHTLSYEQLAVDLTAVRPAEKPTATSVMPWILPYWRTLTICTDIQTS